jgi:hypothetical protein
MLCMSTGSYVPKYSSDDYLASVAVLGATLPDVLHVTPLQVFGEHPAGLLAVLSSGVHSPEVGYNHLVVFR